MTSQVAATGGHAGIDTLESVALAATHGAALACRAWVGRHDEDGADGAATEAMRWVLAHAPGHGTVVIGEGATVISNRITPTPRCASKGGRRMFSVDQYQFEE